MFHVTYSNITALSSYPFRNQISPQSSHTFKSTASNGDHTEESSWLKAVIWMKTVESIPLSISQVMLKLSIRRAKSANKSIWNSNTWKGNGNKWNPWRINLPINLSDSQSTRNVKDVNPTTQPGFINLVWILWQKCFFLCSVLWILITDCSIQELTSGQLKRYY